MLPLVGTPSWNLPAWEPLWAAITETGLPVVMHQGTGHDMLFYPGVGSQPPTCWRRSRWHRGRPRCSPCGGVFERHPELQVVLVEVNVGWMAWTMNTLDEYFVADGAASRKPYLPELPSDYLRRQLHATFQRDPWRSRTRVHRRGVPDVGQPTSRTRRARTNSAKVLTEVLDGVGPDDAAAITGGNAWRVFGFDREVLSALP